MAQGVFGYTRYTQKYASAVFRAGGTIAKSHLWLLDYFVWSLWLWNGDTEKWGLPLEQTFEFIYPFMGGSAASHSFNLVNPDRGRITWVGGLTHNANGVTGNGTSGFGKTGIKFAGNLSGGGTGVTAADTHVIFGCHIFSGVVSNAYDMGNWIQNIPSPPAAPGTLTTSYAGIVTRNGVGSATFYNGLIAGAAGSVSAAVANAYGFRACMRYADNGFIGYWSTGASTLGSLGQTNTAAQGNEGQWCVLMSGEDDTAFSPHTIMSAFLTKSVRGSSPTPGYIYTAGKMVELWQMFQYFNQYMGRDSV